ncbi:hypothetical protein ACFL3L_01510 [Candidatus Neomarinimicrobiota bacterium]
MNRKDLIISRLFRVLIVIVLGYWCYSGVTWLWSWYISGSGYSSAWWGAIGEFLWQNISIVIALYGIACMQASGLVELVNRKSYLKAFGLSLILTPPGMVLVYGHKKEN